MMQPAEMGLRDDPADALRWPRYRRVFVQRQMRASFVVVGHVR